MPGIRYITAPLAAAGIVIAADVASKVAAVRLLDREERARPERLLGVRRTRNTTFLDGGARQVAGVAVSLGLLAAAHRFRDPVLRISLGLIGGGMAANVGERLLTGGVTDWIDTPLAVFNTADVAVGAGLVALAVGMVRA